MIGFVAWCVAIGCGSDPKDDEPATPFGRECNEDVLCEKGLFCADVDGFSNFLCTTRCEGDAECRERYGFAVCIDIDGYCAIDCRDVDCPGDLVCGPDQWCGTF